MDKLELELPPKHSVLSLIQDHPTYGFLQNNANYLLHAISTDILIVPRAQPMQQMELNSEFNMDPEVLLDLLVKMLQLLQDFVPRIHYLVKLHNLKVNVNLFRRLILSFKIRRYFGNGMASY
jgi:hypothetical protein